MKPTVTVSIVTPSYNQAEYLAATMESVLGQDGEFFLDYIVIDGGSTDGSPAIIRRYQEMLDRGEWKTGCSGIRFRWFSEPDDGQSDALLKGFRMAAGDILAWLNSDDLYLPGTLRTITDFFRQFPAVAMVYGDSLYCDAAGTILGRYPASPFDIDRLAFFNFIPQPSTFFRRTAYEAVGGLDGYLNFVMDYDLSIRIGKQFSCRYLSLELSHYRLHEAAKTMRDEVLFDNHEEGVRVAMKHFAWAPLNMVYGSCNHYCRKKIPAPLKRSRFLLIAASLLCTLFRSLWLNRGIDPRDFRLLSRDNLRKLFKDRREILLG